MKYDRIDISERIDIDKTNESRECTFCHYWYFLNKNFSCGPFTCDGCYNMVQRSTDFKDIAIVHIKKVHTEFIFNIWVNIKQKKKFDLVGKMGNIYCND